MVGEAHLREIEGRPWGVARAAIATKHCVQLGWVGGW